MDIPTRRELEDLVKTVQGDAISIYLPTHRLNEKEAVQDPIVLKNLAKDAEDELLRRGHRSTAVRTMLEPIRALISDPDFWAERAAGVAIFRDREQFRTFRTPIGFDALMIVGRQFQITPLVPLLSDPGRFYVLAVSQNHVRLHSGDRFSERVVPVEGLPENLVKALNYLPPEHTFQAHLFVRGPSGVRLKSVHGQGGPSDFAKEEVSEYFRLIDQALHLFLREQRLPLVFAGVDYLFPIYREINNYPHLQDAHVHGSPELMSEHELHQQAWEVLRPRLEQPLHDALRQVAEQAESDDNVCDLAAVLRAAHEGRVDTLLLADGAQSWGTFRTDTEEVQISQPGPDTEDLLNRAAIETLKNAGTIHLCDPKQMPHQSVAAALCRFAVAPPLGSAAVKGKSR